MANPVTAPQFTLKVIEPRFRFLWLRYVRDFKPNVHCAKCLVGYRSRIIDYRNRGREPFTVRGVLDERPFRHLYLCGVTNAWALNLHVAMEASPDESFEVEHEYCNLQVAGARKLAIVEVENPPTWADKSFTTCRNWQFGWNAYPQGFKAGES